MMMSKSMALDGIRWHATDDNKCQHCFAAAKQSPFAPPLAVNVTAGPKNTAEATWTGSADVWQPARNLGDLVLEWRAYKLRMMFGVWSPFMPSIPRQCWWLMAKIQTHNIAELQPGILQTSRPQLSPVMLWWKLLRWTREKYFVNLRDLRLEHKPQWKSLQDTSSVMSWTRCEAEKTTWYIWHSILFTLYDIISYHLVLYCIVFYCIVLYYIILFIYIYIRIITYHCTCYRYYISLYVFTYKYHLREQTSQAPCFYAWVAAMVQGLWKANYAWHARGGCPDQSTMPMFYPKSHKHLQYVLSRSMSQYKYLVEEKALQSRWSKDLCFKRFVQIPQSTYPTSGRTPICHQISKSIHLSSKKHIEIRYLIFFILILSYFILCYIVLIKAFVSLCVTKSVASRPCDARDCTGKKRRKGEKAQTNGFERILHKLHGFHGESRFLSYGGTMRHDHFCSFCGNGEKKASLMQLWNSRFQGSIVPGCRFGFQGRQKAAHQSQTQRLKPNSHCYWELGFVGFIGNQFLFGNGCVDQVDPVWAETSVNVAIYKCLASSLLLRSLPATSAKRLWLGGSFNCMPFYQDNRNTYKYPLLMYPCSIFGNPQISTRLKD